MLGTVIPYMNMYTDQMVFTCICLSMTVKTVTYSFYIVSISLAYVNTVPEAILITVS